MNPLLLIDFYKADHRSQYPNGTTLVYSNFTPRKSRVPGSERMVFFGLQYAIIKYLMNEFHFNFFNQDKHACVNQYRRLMDTCLGPGAVTVDHIAALHDLQYLPLEIHAVPEGMAVPMQTPVLTMWNTHKDFAWITNYLETLMSNLLWLPCTSATTAWEFRKAFNRYAEITGGDQNFVPWQGHDFSFRGLAFPETAMLSGAAHLLSFQGTDTLPAIPILEDYYYCDGLIGGSVAATEHSVMSADDEHDVIDRLLTEVYPKGIVSVVSDTYDFWNLVTEYLPSRKDVIMGRDGKLVIRPDSGVPHKIINGDPEASTECEKLGLVRCLDRTFGHTMTDKGYRQLDSHVGAIYGDSINREEQERILNGLMTHGYASTNVVLGIGSYCYQYVTRDTYGIACKATYCEINGEGRDIFKNPKTGAWKKSHRGLLRVNPDLTTTEGVTWDQQGGELQPVFRDSKLLRTDNLQAIRERLARQ